MVITKGRVPRGAGRPRNDGTRPGQGEFVVKLAITVFPDQNDLAIALGNGNRSAGFRYLADFYLATQEEKRGDDNDQDQIDR